MKEATKEQLEDEIWEMTMQVPADGVARRHGDSVTQASDGVRLAA